ncbi:iron chelate uptake ABC transporter family permease subunit [Moraxella cuniculi]|uniref:Iron-uptake system permease protein FeuC n=1 Tax=Moraxella cuniculi TaxID=34061 RepID=A0A3S4SBY2_9GAMM|nr:iron chelate uptake ABC transporter family permease subunit [Moraxella cuniculi]VEG12671.1 Iron-uptake system permease protein FeuC [Moraxella cuniculi]
MQSLKFLYNLKQYPSTIFAVLLAVACVLFLTINVSGNWDFVLSLRGKKLLALMTVGFAIGTSTLLFQTLTHNPILTPALLGFDSLYVLIKSLMVFFLGSVGLAAIPSMGKFTLEVVIMLSLSLVMFRVLFGRQTQDLTRLVLVGVVFGLLFRSLSYLVARMIDPEEFVTIQSVSYAGFNTINTQALAIGMLLCMLCAVLMYRMRHQLDILLLGRLPAINLGINYHRLGLVLLSTIALLVCVSTAMVGPVTFFGLLVCALTNRLSPSMHHAKRLVMVSLLAMLCLVAGQLVFEQLLNMAGVLEVVIEFVGGVVFLWIVFHQYKKRVA